LKFKRKGKIGKGVFVGLLIGTITGVLIEGLYKKINCTDIFCFNEGYRLVNSVPKAISFSVVGAVIGGFIGSNPIRIKLGPAKNNPKRVKEKILEVL